MRPAAALDVLGADCIEELEADAAALQASLDTILSLHRHKDGYIVFGVKNDGRMQHRDAVRAGALEGIFPQFVAPYFRDGYVSLNSPIAPGASQPGKKHAYLRFPADRTEAVRRGRSIYCETNMRYLNACYCDVDFDTVLKEDGTRVVLGDVLAEMQNLVESGELPAPTMYVESGNGAWFLWYLHSNREQLQSHRGCQPDVIVRYKAVNRAIQAKLAHLGGDPIADAARFTAMHGSTKTHASVRVAWHPHPGGRSYSLNELEQLVAVRDVRGSALKRAAEDMGRERARSRGKRGDVSPEVSERCSRGWKRSATARLAHFDQLLSLRGKFTQGERDKAAFIYAACLRSAAIAEEEARRLVRRFGAECCEDPLPPYICDQKVKSAYSLTTNMYPDGNLIIDKGQPMMVRRRPISYQEMANWLQVTRDEAAEMTRNVGTPFPPATSQGVIVAPLSAAEKRDRRREAIRAIHRLVGLESLTYDELAQMLADRRIFASRGTLFNDLSALQLTTKGYGAETVQTGRIMGAAI